LVHAKIGHSACITAQQPILGFCAVSVMGDWSSGMILA
jgi:hypothetical protein